MTPSVRRVVKAPRVVVSVVSAALASAVTLLSAGCSAPLLKLPSGPSAPASDGQIVLDQATGGCRAVSTVTLEMAVQGSVGGQRLRARLSAGLAKPASARLEAVVSFGQPAFFFVANDADATLLLPRDKRVARGRPAALLEAVAGVPLDATALRAVLTGCAGMADAAGMRAFGENWRVTTDAAGRDEIYLRRGDATAPWQILTTVHHAAEGGWRAEYANFEGGLPRTIRLLSTPAGRFDLQLQLSQLEVNTPLGAEVFQLQVPVAAEPIGVDELRRSGPLGAK
jgi:hypothetical protein